MQVFEGLDVAASKAATLEVVSYAAEAATDGDLAERAADATAAPSGLAASAGAVRGALAALGSALGGRFALGEMEDAADALLVILDAIDEEVAKGVEAPIDGTSAIASVGVAKETFGTTVAEYTFCGTCRRRWSAAR